MFDVFHRAKEMTATKGGVIFFDRCFLEGVSYYQTLEVEDSDKYDHLASQLRYHSVILMAPPWREIYCQDDERKHSFEEAVVEYEQLLQFYPKYGYECLELPRIGMKGRFQFVTSLV